MTPRHWLEIVSALSAAPVSGPVGGFNDSGICRIINSGPRLRPFRPIERQAGAPRNFGKPTSKTPARPVSLVCGVPAKKPAGIRRVTGEIKQQRAPRPFHAPECSAATCKMRTQTCVSAQCRKMNESRPDAKAHCRPAGRRPSPASVSRQCRRSKNHPGRFPAALVSGEPSTSQHGSGLQGRRRFCRFQSIVQSVL